MGDHSDPQPCESPEADFGIQPFVPDPGGDPRGSPQIMGKGLYLAALAALTWLLAWALSDKPREP